MNEEDDKVIDITTLLKKRKIESQKETKDDEHEEAIKLYEIADIIVGLSILLDEVGQHEYADKISSLMKEMFEDKNITPELWGWEKE